MTGYYRDWPASVHRFSLIRVLAVDYGNYETAARLRAAFGPQGDRLPIG
ncbi:MAG TPA: hypothetical protein VGY55_07075 [Pirellulales bacterium]|jgi:hypothetical protein|nr:hypothetical protein [Pirellulales bacterium]